MKQRIQIEDLNKMSQSSRCLRIAINSRPLQSMDISVHSTV